MAAKDIEIVGTLRNKNQITLPEQIASELGLKQGDRIVFRLERGRQPEVIQLRPLRRSYAGALAGVYGSEEEALDYVRDERAAWDR